MPRPAVVLALAALLAPAGAACAQPVPADGGLPPRLPEPEVTQQKVAALGEKLQTMERLRDRLRDLGNPTKKEVGETDQEYLTRVDRILKGRALYVHLLHQEIQDALEAKYALESYLEDYRRWADTMAKMLKVQPERYRSRLVKLEQAADELAKDLVVLADMTHDQAEAEGDDKLARRMEGDYTDALLESIPDRPRREAKFADLKTLGEKVARYEELLGQLDTSRWEMNLLETTVIRETEAFADVLPAAHARNLKDLEETLVKNKKSLLELELTGHRVAILAGYVYDGLKLVRPDGGKAGDIATQLATLNANAPAINKAFDDYMGVSTGVPSGVGFANMGSRRQLFQDLIRGKESKAVQPPPKN